MSYKPVKNSEVSQLVPCILEQYNVAFSSHLSFSCVISFCCSPNFKCTAKLCAVKMQKVESSKYFTLEIQSLNCTK